MENSLLEQDVLRGRLSVFVQLEKFEDETEGRDEGPRDGHDQVQVGPTRNRLGQPQQNN